MVFSASVVLAIAAAVIAVFAAIARSSRRREAERAEGYRKAASLRGWRLELTPESLIYSGTTEGIAWTFTAARHLRNEEVRVPSRWETRSVTSDEVRVVWAREAGRALSVEVPDFVRNLALQKLGSVLGIDGKELAAARHDDPAMARAIEGTEIIGAIASRDGIRIVVPTVIQAPEEVEKIVRAGVALARTQRS